MFVGKETNVASVSDYYLMPTLWNFFIFTLDFLPQLTWAALNPLQFSQRLKHADELRTEIRSFLYCGEQVIIGLGGVPLGTETHTHVRSEPNYISIPFS
jgi:hypothetical protein